MTQPLLSILIPTVFGREAEYDRLFANIARSAGEDGILGIVQVSRLKDNKMMTIGEKRQMLYEKAQGLYSWQIDDDDDIAPDAIEKILTIIRQNEGVDCITFEERCLMNGRRYTCNHSLKYDDWQDNFDGYDFVRTPFYKDVIKTEIAKWVPFEKIRYGEDHAFARALKPHLKSEHHIDEELYYYIYEPKESHEERYGIR